MRESLAGLRANPGYLPAVIDAARIAFYMGDIDLALRLLERVGQIDPTINIHTRKAQYLFFAGKLRQSSAEQKKAEQQESQRVSADALILMGQTYAWLGDFAGAERTLARLEKLQPNAKAAAEIRAWIAASQGRKADALEQMQKFPAGPRWGIAQENAALYAVLGDREDALQWLQRAVEMGAPSYIWYRSEHFRSLRGDPRYEGSLKQLSDEYAQLRPELHSVAETALHQK
jgi:tetratricopeptide (TPR) repeat protein